MELKSICLTYNAINYIAYNINQYILKMKKKKKTVRLQDTGHKNEMDAVEEN